MKRAVCILCFGSTVLHHCCHATIRTYSVHVRRTDKLKGEAKFHGIEEYMFHVNQYYEYLETRQTVDRRRVYIATDDPSVLKQAKNKCVIHNF